MHYQISFQVLLSDTCQTQRLILTVRLDTDVENEHKSKLETFTAYT